MTADPENQQADAAPTGTRAALLAAGLHLFGTKGFDATSTRELADLAATNVASIAYHFGGKAGLHLGCGAEVARRMQAVVGKPGPLSPVTTGEARQRLEAMTRAFVAFLNGSHGANDIVAFMLREVATGGPVLDQLYVGMIEPKHREFCHLWAAATGQDGADDEVKLGVFAFVGQVLYFRIGREIILRRMNWAEDPQIYAATVADRLVANLHNLLNQGART